MTVVVCLLLLAVGVIRLGLAELKPNEVEATLRGRRAEHDIARRQLLGDGGASSGTAGTTAPQEACRPASTQPASDRSVPVTVETTTTTSTTTTTTTTTLPSEPVDYLAVGDSVMLGAAGVLTVRGYTVDAHVSRQMIDMVPIFQQFGEADLFGDPVIIHLGTNGPFDAETLDALLAPLSQRAERDHAQRPRQPLVDREQQRLARRPRQARRQHHPHRLGRARLRNALATASPPTASTSTPPARSTTPT